jgi:hypothetical protein
MATPILKRKDRKALFLHMNIHMENSSVQYAAWAKYALKIELSPQDCSELFMEGLHSEELLANP